MSSSSSVVGNDVGFRETADLRKSDVYNTHASARPISSPYAGNTEQLKITNGLPIGTQQRMIDAAEAACNQGTPLNAFLSVRWRGLFAYDESHPLRTLDGTRRVQYLMDLIRRWLKYRSLPALYLWSREYTDKCGEHWHLALHLPHRYRRSFGEYVGNLLQEPVGIETEETTIGEVARSVWSSWHFAGEVKFEKSGKFSGYWLAAYTGKGEPSQRVFRNRLVNNNHKTVRGRQYGGDQKDGTYDYKQGVIRGTTSRKGRFEIARALRS